MSNVFIERDEIKEFREVLRKYFKENYTEKIRKELTIKDSFREKRRELLSSDESKRIFKEIFDLGVFHANLPEKYGGLNLGYVALGAIVEESARSLFPFPVFESAVLGLLPLVEFGNENDVEACLQSSLILTSGFNAYSCIALGEMPEYSVAGSGNVEGGISINGELKFIPGFYEADVILVPIILDDLIYLSLVNKQNVPASSFATMDLFREFAEAKFNATPGKIISQAISFDSFRKMALLISCFALTEMIGVTRASLELTIEYVKNRKQFGKAIGSFQAIQHKLADVHLHLEEVASLVKFAISEADRKERDSSQFISAALAAIPYACEVLPRSIEDCLQAHGGIGFTYEYPLHYYLRRAQTISLMLMESGFSYSEISKIELDQVNTKKNLSLTAPE